MYVGGGDDRNEHPSCLELYEGINTPKMWYVWQKFTVKVRQHLSVVQLKSPVNKRLHAFAQLGCGVCNGKALLGTSAPHTCVKCMCLKA